jgi:hypothetical protein
MHFVRHGSFTIFEDDVFGLEIFNTKDIVPAFSLTVTKSDARTRTSLGETALSSWCALFSSQ